MLDAPETLRPNGLDSDISDPGRKESDDDAQVMKTRSSQKDFVLVRISRLGDFRTLIIIFGLSYIISLHILLKEGSFECHDAGIKRRELEYRNQTWSVRKFAYLVWLLGFHSIFSLKSL